MWFAMESFMTNFHSMSKIYLMLSVLVLITSEYVDLRISKGNVQRENEEGNEYVRITSISDGPLSSDVFEYSAPFKYRWTDKFLNTGVMMVKSGTSTSVTINGTTYDFFVPAEGEGVIGVFIADPCFNNQYLSWCTFGDVLNTAERTPAILNAIHEHNDTHYWGILGDNFYDQNGVPTSHFFSKLSKQSKTKLFISVPGNHDYWLCGSPKCFDHENDQMGNGFMQVIFAR